MGSTGDDDVDDEDDDDDDGGGGGDNRRRRSRSVPTAMVTVEDMTLSVLSAGKTVTVDDTECWTLFLVTW